MLKAKILQLAHSRFGCRPFIPYKSDGSLIFCLDQRPPNKVIESTKFPIPDMHEMVQSVNGSKFFACLDAAQGYFQWPLTPCSYKYEATLTMEGVYEFMRIIIGTKNSAGYFQDQMQRTLEGRMDPVVHLDSQKTSLSHIPDRIRNARRLNLTEHGILQYLDDTLIHVPSEELLFTRIKMFLTRMQPFGNLLETKEMHPMVKRNSFPRLAHLRERSFSWPKQNKGPQQRSTTQHSQRTPTVLGSPPVVKVKAAKL
jgi:hypothetical protein